MGKLKKVWNHTPYEVASLPKMFDRLGSYRNVWRARTVTLYRVGPGQLVSVGACDDGDVVVAVEPDEYHARALDAFKYGRSYVAD